MFGLPAAGPSMTGMQGVPTTPSPMIKPPVPPMPASPRGMPVAGAGVTKPVGASPNMLQKLFGALSDPDGAAEVMAREGVTPDDFKKSPGKVADLVKPRIIQPGDPGTEGMSRATGDEFIGSGQLAKFLTGGVEAGKTGLTAGLESLGNLVTPSAATPLKDRPPMAESLATNPALFPNGVPQALATGPVSNFASSSPVANALARKPVGNFSGTGMPNAPAPAMPIAPPIAPVTSELPTSPIAPASPAGGFVPEKNVMPKLEGRPARANAGQAMVRGMRGEIREHISKVATQYGLDPNAMMTMAMIESGGNPSAKNPSGAAGLYQFMPGTAKDYGLKNPLDYKASTDAAARLAISNRKYLMQNLGREPTWGELYLAHQQGAGGALKLLSNPGAKAADLVGKQAVVQNGGTADMTGQEFANLWIDKFNNFGAGGGGGGGSAGGGNGEGVAPFPKPPGGEGESGSDMWDALAGLKVPEGGASNQPDAPNALLPQPGNYQGGDVVKLLLAMLGPSGGPGAMAAPIPTLTQLMSGASLPSGRG